MRTLPPHAAGIGGLRHPQPLPALGEGCLSAHDVGKFRPFVTAATAGRKQADYRPRYGKYTRVPPTSRLTLTVWVTPPPVAVMGTLYHKPGSCGPERVLVR